MSTTSTVSSQTNPVAVVAIAPIPQVPDIVHNDLIMSKILGCIDTNETFNAVSLTSKKFKRIMDEEVHKRVDALMANREMVSFFKPCEHVDCSKLQLMIDERCDDFGIQCFSIFKNDRCQQFLEFSRAFDFCYFFLNSWFVSTKLEGISFNPGKLFSQTDRKPREEREALIKNFDNASKKSKEKLAVFKELINEYDSCIKEIATLQARAADVNPYFLICKWLRMNNLISDQLLHEINACIEKKASEIINDATLRELSFNCSQGTLCLSEDVKSALDEIFSTEAFVSVRNIASIAIETLGPLSSFISPKNRSILSCFPGFDKLRKLTKTQGFCVILNTDEEAKWIEAAKKLTLWVPKATKAGLLLKHNECDGRFLHQL